MTNHTIKNLITVIATAIISTIIITLPMRLLLDELEQYKPSQNVEIIYTPINK